MLLTCRALVQHLTELEEGTLPAHDRLLARMHLALCSNCRRYRDQLVAARRALSALSERAADESFGAFEARVRARRVLSVTEATDDDRDRRGCGSGPPS